MNECCASVLPKELPEELLAIARQRRLFTNEDIDGVERLAGDGSGRKFWRLKTRGARRFVVIAPEYGNVAGMREAAAVYAIGRHLAGCGVPVPEIHGYSDRSGILVCEDLGDIHLHRVAVATDWGDDDAVCRLRDLYRQAAEVLAAMQWRGRAGFNTAWCWDTPRYDQALMLERESGYFLRAFWQKMLGQVTPSGLENEFTRLAALAAQAPADVFLHRDFQSRNLMEKDGRIRVIDFQGGRLGPAGYDLASLLLDPYSALPKDFQEDIYGWYVNVLAGLVTVNHEQFRLWYQALRLQRNLQIIGAFAFLGSERQKVFFLDYLLPALDALIDQVSDGLPLRLPVLLDTACRARDLYLSSMRSKR